MRSAAAGRAGCAEAVRAWARGAAGPGGGALTVEGEPGAGRTTLLRAALAEAARGGFRVRFAAAEGPGLPLRAALDCLYPDGCGAAGSAQRAAVIALLREAGPAPGSTGSGGALLAAMDLLVTGVREECAGGPLLLALDDVHAADPASLLVWRRLARAGADGLPVRLAVTRRPLPRRPEVDHLWAALLAVGGGCAVRLEPLTGDESAALVRELLGAPPGPRLREAAARAGGNPRLLRELLAQWSGAGLLRVRRAGSADQAELTVAEDELPAAPAAIAQGLDCLSPGAHATLRHATLLGAEFTVAELGLVRARPVRELAAELEEPVLAGVLEDAGARLRFRQPALREALYGTLPGAVRAALHQAAARAFAEAAATDGPDAGSAPARIAEQLLDGGPLAPWALRWLAGAAQPLIAAAPGPAAELIQRAVTQTRTAAHAAPGAPAELDELEERLADAALLLRRPESVALLEALRARAGDPDRLAALEFKLVSALMIQGDMDRALAVTERALAEPFPSVAWRLRLDACRVLALADLGRAGRAHELAAAVVERADRLGDPLCGAEAHHAMAYALFHLGRARASLRHVAEGIACARRTPAANDMRLLLLANLAEGHTRLEEPEAVAGALREARQLAAETRSTGRLAVTETRLAEFRYRLGDWDAALAGVARARRLPASDGWLPAALHGLRALVLGHRDEPEAARAELAALPDGATATDPALRYCGHLLLARALLAERDGRTGAALAALVPVLERDGPAATAHEHPWTLSEIVRLALESGDPGTARAAVAACVDAVRAQPEHPGAATALLRCRGLFGQDPGLLREVVARGERGCWPLLPGRALEDLAVALAWRGDLAGSRDALTRSVAVYEGLGARWDITRADARLRRLGVRRGSRGPRRTAASGWEALTPAELKVALLVARGRSNPEIARALFLSRRTVQTHVSHILGKLQVRSRAEVAAHAAGRSAADD
ncbi:LuxR C-terminal-related transcriptional regulator [Streptomyces sp. NBC_00536]|uniref:LuxR C-terminal-related transcriptional regulator n=1 Tax=Streptomyces sp. NBC_00536 TaxID=2975769 RepID=UPI002E8183AA|nr:LuxR C-terminal-related transcriptional regulator [Streptomyces sp. NBC_00536]